jgi:hypothetical protein
MTKFLLSLALTGLAWSGAAVACDDGSAMDDHSGGAALASQERLPAQKSTRPVVAQKATKSAKVACTGQSCKASPNPVSKPPAAKAPDA